MATIFAKATCRLKTKVMLWSPYLRPEGREQRLRRRRKGQDRSRRSAEVSPLSLGPSPLLTRSASLPESCRSALPAAPSEISAVIAASSGVVCGVRGYRYPHCAEDLQARGGRRSRCHSLIDRAREALIALSGHPPEVEHLHHLSILVPQWFEVRGLLWTCSLRPATVSRSLCHSKVRVGRVQLAHRNQSAMGVQIIP